MSLKLKSDHSLDDFLVVSQLNKRTIMFWDEVNELTSERFIQKFDYLAGQSKRRTIRILMNTQGGDVFDGLSIYNTIRDSKIPVTIEVNGLCASMGTVILQAAKHRLSRQKARFMIHEIRELKMGEEETASQSEEKAKELKKVNRMIVQILAERTGKSYVAISKLIKKTDYWMSPEEALEFNLIDRIIK